MKNKIVHPFLLILALFLQNTFLVGFVDPNKFPGFTEKPKDNTDAHARKIFANYTNECLEYMRLSHNAHIQDLEKATSVAAESLREAVREAVEEAEKAPTVEGAQFLSEVDKTMTRKDYIGDLPPEIEAIIERGKKENQENYKRFEVQLPSTVLFTGPPGTGKTLLAKLIAGEWGYPFYTVLDLSSALYNREAEKLTAVFKEAETIAKNAPDKTIVLFIDEIDKIAKKRGTQSEYSLHNSAVTVLLTNVDGIIHKKPLTDENCSKADVSNEKEDIRIILIGATNNKDILDPAFLSRVNSVINVPLPDADKRKNLLEMYTKVKNVPVSSAIDFDAFALAMDGMSARDISSLALEARTLAAHEKAQEVMPEHLKKAMLNKMEQLGISNRNGIKQTFSIKTDNQKDCGRFCSALKKLSLMLKK